MEAKEEIRSRLSVEDVVSGYLELKRSGRNFKALSPFTNEKTASFMVSPEKQIWHDFSSGKGGDIFSFVMEMEGVDFVEAMQILARKAGVDLSQYGRGDGQTAKRKKQIIDMTTLAAQYYHSAMSKSATAKDYLVKRRGLNRGTITDFKLGYSPESGTALLGYLQKKGYKPTDIQKAGLAVKRGARTVDMFRGRLMVPLADGQGQLIGFTARLLQDQPNAPKYINTPQTLIYDKSRHVFGLHHAKQAIREADEAIVAEGQFDVISAHQAGSKNVVAAAGTALTVFHLKQLCRLSENAKLAFDQDEAGIKATIRAVAMAQEAEINLSIISMPQGSDPDELIRKSKSAWQKVVKDARYIMDWLIDYYRHALDLKTARGKKLFADNIVQIIARLSDPVEQDHYLQMVANEAGVSIEAVRNKLKSTKQTKTPAKKSTAKAEKTGPATYAYQDSFLGLNALFPDVRTSLSSIEVEQMEGAQRQQLFGFLRELGEKKMPNKFPDALSELDNYAKV
ncbi:MAG: DNA primase, partial [Candidatus Saccharimonadales bacterium]|nr:DNA primase [Candidatus Saccharimonadales bacterium]